MITILSPQRVARPAWPTARPDSAQRVVRSFDPLRDRVELGNPLVIVGHGTHPISNMRSSSGHGRAVLLLSIKRRVTTGLPVSHLTCATNHIRLHSREFTSRRSRANQVRVVAIVRPLSASRGDGFTRPAASALDVVQIASVHVRLTGQVSQGQLRCGALAGELDRTWTAAMSSCWARAEPVSCLRLSSSGSAARRIGILAPPVI